MDYKILTIGQCTIGRIAEKSLNEKKGGSNGQARGRERCQWRKEEAVYKWASERGRCGGTDSRQALEGERGTRKRRKARWVARQARVAAVEGTPGNPCLLTNVLSRVASRKPIHTPKSVHRATWIPLWIVVLSSSIRTLLCALVSEKYIVKLN